MLIFLNKSLENLVIFLTSKKDATENSWWVFPIFHVKQIGKGGKAASEKITFYWMGTIEYWAICIFVEIWSCVYCKYVGISRYTFFVKLQHS